MKQQAQRFIHKTYRGLGTNIYFTAFGSANSKDLDDSYALLKACQSRPLRTDGC